MLGTLAVLVLHGGLGLAGAVVLGLAVDHGVQGELAAVADLGDLDLDLLRPIYSLTTNYGHFGRELPEFTWERTDRAEALAKAVKG